MTHILPPIFTAFTEWKSHLALWNFGDPAYYKRHYNSTGPLHNQHCLFNNEATLTAFFGEILRRHYGYHKAILYEQSFICLEQCTEAKKGPWDIAILNTKSPTVSYSQPSDLCKEILCILEVKYIQYRGQLRCADIEKDISNLRCVVKNHQPIVAVMLIADERGIQSSDCPSLSITPRVAAHNDFFDESFMNKAKGDVIILSNNPILSSW